MIPWKIGKAGFFFCVCFFLGGGCCCFVVFFLTDIPNIVYTVHTITFNFAYTIRKLFLSKSD